MRSGGMRTGMVLMVGAALALQLMGCASSRAHVGTPGDAEVKAIAALVTQAQDANGRGDLKAAKVALLKARGGMAQASNALVMHPRFMKLVNDLSMAEAAVEQAETARAQPVVVKETVAKKAAPKAKKPGRKVSRN